MKLSEKYDEIIGWNKDADEGANITLEVIQLDSQVETWKEQTRLEAKKSLKLMNKVGQLEADKEMYYKLNAAWLRDPANVMWASGWCHVCGQPAAHPDWDHADDCGYEAWAKPRRDALKEVSGATATDTQN